MSIGYWLIIKYLPQIDALNRRRHSEYTSDIFHPSYFRVCGSRAVIARSHNDVIPADLSRPMLLQGKLFIPCNSNKVDKKKGKRYRFKTILK